MSVARIIPGVCLLILFCLTTSTTARDRSYTFGINLALDPIEAGSYYSSQAESLIGLQVWRDWWNALPVDQRTSKSGEVISVELHVETWSGYSPGFTSGTLASLTEAYSNMTTNSTIDYLFAPVALWGVAVRQSMYNRGVSIMMGSTDSSEGYYAIPGSFGTPTANILALSSWPLYLRIQKASTLVILMVQDWVYQSEMCGGLIDQAPDNDLTVVYQEKMPFDWATQGAIDGNPTSIATWTATLDRVIQLNPDAIAICDYNFGAEFSLRYFREKGWTPKSIAISPLYKQIDPTLLPYVVTTAPYSQAAKYRKQSHFTDSLGYNTLIRGKYSREATSIMAQATLAGMLYTAALVSASSNSTTDLLAAMRVTQLRSFMGPSVFDAFGRQTLSALVTQFHSNGQNVSVVGPAAAAIDTFVYPMPKWEERVFSPKWGSPAEIAGTVIILIGVAVVIGWAIFLIVYWNDDIIVAASPIFCVIILAGCLAVCLSLFTWMPGTVSSSVCMLRVWLLPIGFMLMFGALLAKTYRIHKIFTADSLSTFGISTAQVVIWVSIIVGVKVGFSIITTSVSSIKAVIHTVDPIRPSKSYYVCTFPLAAKIVFGFDMAYAACLLTWGSYLAFKVRKVKRAQYDESNVIAFSIYNVFFFAVIVVAVQFAIGNSYRNLTFLLTVICSVLGACITASCLFGTKVYAIHRREYKSSHSQSATNSTGSRSKNYSSGRVEKAEEMKQVST